MVVVVVFIKRVLYSNGYYRSVRFTRSTQYRESILFPASTFEPKTTRIKWWIENDKSVAAISAGWMAGGGGSKMGLREEGRRFWLLILFTLINHFRLDYVIWAGSWMGSSCWVRVSSKAANELCMYSIIMGGLKLEAMGKWHVVDLGSQRQ